MNVVTYSGFKNELEKISSAGHAAVDIAGLGMLAAPTLSRHFGGEKGEWSEKNKRRSELAGLGTLAAGVAHEHRGDFANAAKKGWGAAKGMMKSVHASADPRLVDGALSLFTKEAISLGHLAAGTAAVGAIGGAGYLGHKVGKSQGREQGVRGGFRMGQSTGPNSKLFKTPTGYDVYTPAQKTASIQKKAVIFGGMAGMRAAATDAQSMAMKRMQGVGKTLSGTGAKLAPQVPRAIPTAKQVGGHAFTQATTGKYAPISL